MSYYLGKNGQTIYDISIELYGDVSAVLTLLQWNDTITLTSDLSGMNIYYESLVFDGFKPVVTEEKSNKKTVTIKSNQSIFDLSLQIFGTVERVFEVGNLSTNLEGVNFSYEYENTAVASYFYNKKISVSTLYKIDTSYRIIWDGEYNIWDGVFYLGY
jgi:hypothetical protein